MAVEQVLQLDISVENYGNVRGTVAMRGHGALLVADNDKDCSSDHKRTTER